MNNNFKKTFFSSLLSVLVIISNLVSIKYTQGYNLILPVNFAIFPFIFLCYLLVLNLSNKKEALSSLLSSVFIQIFILISFVIVTKLNSQNIVPDFASSVNEVFRVSEISIITNLIALIISTFILQYIYDYFSKFKYRLIGVVIAFFSSIVLYGLITIPIINYDFGIDIIYDMLISHLIISFVMTLFVTIFFYLLKEKYNCYNGNKIFIKDMEVVSNNNLLNDSSNVSSKKKSSSKENSDKVTKKQTRKKVTSKKDVKK